MKSAKRERIAVERIIRLKKILKKLKGRSAYAAKLARREEES